MRGITSNTQARIQAQQLRYLTDTCSISVRTSGTDEYGGADQINEVVAVNVACIVLPLDSKSVEALSWAGQENIGERYKLVCAQGTALAPDQIITIGTDVYHVASLTRGRTNETSEQAIIIRATTT